MARASFVAFGFPMEGTMRAPIPTPEGLPAQAANHHHGLPLRVFVGSVALRHNQSDDRHWRRRSGALHCGGLWLRSSLCAEADVIGPPPSLMCYGYLPHSRVVHRRLPTTLPLLRGRSGESMFLALHHGVMYVCSFAMVITGIVTVLALALWLVRGVWRLLAKEGETLMERPMTAPGPALASTNKYVVQPIESAKQQAASRAQV